MFSQVVKNKDGVEKTVVADTEADLAAAVKDVEAQTAPKSFDINEPVEQGHDVVLNHENGDQTLGTGNDREKLVNSENVLGQHTDPMPSDPSQDESKDETPAEDAKPAKK